MCTALTVEAIKMYVATNLEKVNKQVQEQKMNPHGTGILEQV